MSQGLALSVIVATHNRAAKLRLTLEALAEQETPSGLEWEVLVVDNGSTDLTLEEFRRAAMRTPGRFRYMFEPRLGKSRALNSGLKVARGGVIALTDDDVSPARDWVATAATVLDRWKVDGAGGRILPRWEVEAPAWLVRSRRLLDTLAIMDYDKPRMLPLPPGMHPQVWGANMVYRRSALVALDGFDPNLGPVGGRRFCSEDIDIVRRMLAAGFAMAYDPGLTVYHRVPRARLRRAYFRRAMWDMGEGDALAATTPPRGRCIHGVPIWLLAFLTKFAVESSLHTMARRPGAFDQVLNWTYHAGFAWGLFRHARIRRREGQRPGTAPATAPAIRAPH